MTTRPIRFNRYGHEVSTHCGQNNPYGCGAPLDVPDGHSTNVAFHAARFFKTRDEGEAPMTDPTAELERLTARIALLRRAAEGRREYADGIGETETNPALVEARMALLTEAATLESAAKIMEGDDRTLYGLLPSWRWTDEMEQALATADNMPKENRR